MKEQQTERWHAVYLNSVHIGDLIYRGNVTRFRFVDDYWSRPDRPVLGLQFEDNPKSEPRGNMKLPSWFSNLLPEDPLRTWIANDRDVSPDREMELLIRIGRDLPGAVIVDEVARESAEAGPTVLDSRSSELDQENNQLKFSLAGVAMKFSTLQRGDRLVLPGRNQIGSWIVKLPDPNYEQVPSNEAAMMTLAGLVGIEVPEHRLVHRDLLGSEIGPYWASKEVNGYAVKRFDRTDRGTRVHIEDFAQVKGIPADRTSKYQGTFETVGSYCFRGRDVASLMEWTRRMAFNLAIGNGDAHLKNWSLIYPDTKRPKLSPAYDLVSTVQYLHSDNFGLLFNGEREFRRIRPDSFKRFGDRLRESFGSQAEVTGDDLEGEASRTMSLVQSNLDEVIDVYPHVKDMIVWVRNHTEQMRRQLCL